MKTLSLLTLAFLSLAGLASAQTWTNPAAGNWDTAANWNPNTVPNSSAADARITNFTATGSYTIDASSTQTNTVNRLDFGNSNNANAVTNILAANAGLRFQGSSAQLNLFTAGANSALTIAAPITLGTNLTVSLSRNGGNQISPNFNGAIDLGIYEFRFGATRLAGINMNSAISGTGRLVFQGPGSDRTVVFTNTNSTFSGGVNLDAAGNVLQLGNTATFSGNATSGLLGTGSINFNSTVDSLSSASSPKLQANGVFFSDRNDSTNNVLANAIVISNGRFGIIDTPRGLNTTGDISGSGKLYKITGSSSGDRAWAINNANTNFSGTVELRDGQVFTRVTDALGSNSTFIFASQSGVNGVALAGANTNGASVKLGSTLVFSNTTNQVYIQASGGSTFELSGNFSNAGSGTAGSINFSRGDNILTTNGGGFSIGNNTGIATFILSGTGSLSNRIALVNAGATTSLVLSNTSGTQTFSGEIASNGNLTRAGAGGTTVLTGSNSFTGTTTVSAGTLNLNATTGSALAGSTNVTVSGGILLISKSNQVRDLTTVTLSGGTIERGTGVSETFGALNLTAASTLNFGSGTEGNLTFGVYEGGGTPDFKLTVNNFFIGNTLVFGSNLSSFITNSYTGTAFTSTWFDINSTSGGFTSAWNGSTFTITAVPEPSTIVAALGLAGLMLWPAVRRLRGKRQQA